MKIAVLGAGAVGCYYGGMLARAGHRVTLIGRPVHVDAMRRDGLLLETRAFTERVPVAASTEADAARGAELVLVCVKSADTEAAGDALRGLPAGDAAVLSLQNGVDNAPRLAERLGQPVRAAVVYVATEMAGPGHVRHHGRGELVIGPGPGSEALVSCFGTAGVPVQVSDQVLAALWSKLIVNCAYNALSALGQVAYGALVRQPGVDALMRDVVAECRAVAAALGVAVPSDSMDDVARIAATMPGQRSSTAQDLARGRPSEIDHLNGHVVRQGEACGIPTPANRALWLAVKLTEARLRCGPPAGSTDPRP